MTQVGCSVVDPVEPIDLATERAALGRALDAVQAKLDRLAGIAGGGADALADEYIDAVVRGTIEQLQHELVVFGRIDDDHVCVTRRKDGPCVLTFKDEDHVWRLTGFDGDVGMLRTPRAP